MSTKWGVAEMKFLGLSGLNQEINNSKWLDLGSGSHDGLVESCGVLIKTLGCMQDGF